jgi:hypothetical protein
MERKTHYRGNEDISVPVAAATLCEAGNIGVINAGYAEPGSEALGLIIVGRFEETVDNTAGAAGAKVVNIRTGKSFQWKNSPTDPIAQAQVGTTCYIEDAITVSKTDNGGARSVAGIITGVDSGGVWVTRSL